MAVKIYKPVTPSLRGMTGYTFEEITKGKKPEPRIVDVDSWMIGRLDSAARTASSRETKSAQRAIGGITWPPLPDY